MLLSNRLLRKVLPLTIGLIASSIPGHTQATGPHREVLTNRSIVTLAEAGFDEEFIIETIATSHSRFDVTVDGLASLARQGVNERIIRVMMNGTGMPAQAAMLTGAPAPDLDPATRAGSAQRGASLAIVSRTPYYETRSYFWGLFKRGVRIGVAPRAQDVGPHLGAVYERYASR